MYDAHTSAKQKRGNQMEKTRTINLTLYPNEEDAIQLMRRLRPTLQSDAAAIREIMSMWKMDHGEDSNSSKTAKLDLVIHNLDLVIQMLRDQ